MRMGPTALVVTAVLTCGLQSTADALGRGGFRQLSGRAGCVVAKEGQGCLHPHGARGKFGWALSPDAANLYGLSNHGLVVLRRSARDGGFRELRGSRGCLRATRVRGCGRVRVLRGIAFGTLLAAPDGRSVHVLAEARDRARIVSFRRDAATGRLHYPRRGGCVASRATAGCAKVAPLRDTIDVATSSPDSRDLYAVTASAIVQLRRDAGGGLQPVAGPAGCLSPRRPSCRRTSRFPSSSDGTDVQASADGRNIYVTHFGHVFGGDGTTYPGAITTFAREPLTGVLTQLPPPAGCLTVLFELPRGCRARSVLNPLFVPPVFIGDEQSYATTFDPVGPSTSIVALARDPGTGALAPVGTGACVGRSWEFDVGEPTDAAFTLGGPCIPARELDVPSAAPLVTADGQNVYLSSISTTNFDDFPTDWSYSAVVGLVRNAATGHLSALPAPRGCLGARRVRGCRPLERRFYPNALVEIPETRTVVLSSTSPLRGKDHRFTLRALRRARSGGALTRVGGSDGCVASAPRRGCRLVRGLIRPLPPDYIRFVDTTPDLAFSPDGRFMYAMADGVAVFRIRLGS